MFGKEAEGIEQEDINKTTAKKKHKVSGKKSGKKKGKKKSKKHHGHKKAAAKA